MDNKYRVPAVDKANALLQAIAAEPYKLKLIDLSRKLELHKSTVFSLLHTLETLRWVEKDKGDTYGIGPAIGILGQSYLRQFHVVERFRQEAQAAMANIGETLQLARLEGRDIFYLSKVEAPSPVRLASDPGVRLPAHATALGKALLSTLESRELETLYPEEMLPAPLTPHTLTAREALLGQLEAVRRSGVAYDLEEAVLGFCCAAAPVFDPSGQAVAAVSCSMPLHTWQVKREAAADAVARLAAGLSH